MRQIYIKKASIKYGTPDLVKVDAMFLLLKNYNFSGAVWINYYTMDCLYTNECSCERLIYRFISDVFCTHSTVRYTVIPWLYLRFSSKVEDKNKNTKKIPND